MQEQAGREIDCFVAGMGTGGTFMGTGAFLRSRKRGARIIGVEPKPGHKIQIVPVHVRSVSSVKVRYPGSIITGGFP